MSIVVNSRGASDATSFEKISTVGYPLSISEKFQLSNTKMKIHESLILVDEIFNKCIQKNKNFQVYFSMAFGNPYNESWNIDILLNFIQKISDKGIKLISLADTVGISTNKQLEDTLRIVLGEFEEMDIGLLAPWAIYAMTGNLVMKDVVFVLINHLKQDGFPL